MKRVFGIALFVIYEAIVFYVYSFLWLMEGQPKYHDDPTLKFWAWVCIGASLLPVLAFAHWLSRRSAKK